MLSTLLAFVLTLGVLIVVHEYGHYKVARLCGVRVLRFSVGFGRVVWRRQPRADGTEFTLSALPLGGYVKMLDSREGPVPDAWLSQAFDRQPLRRRVAIVAAGPLANLGLAVLLYAASHWWGIEEPKAVLSAPVAGSLAEQAGLRSGDWVRAMASPDGTGWQELASLTELRWEIAQAVLDGRGLTLEVSDRDGSHRRQLTLATDRLSGQDMDEALLRRVGLGVPFAEPVLGELRPEGAAAKAGLLQGDRVLTIDEQLVPDAQTLRERVRAYTGQTPALRFQVLRAGQTLTREVTPRLLTEGGKTQGRIDAFVGTPPAMVLVQTGLWEGAWRGLTRTAETVDLSLRMIKRMLTGEASVRNLGGPLTIADQAGQSARLGVAYYLGFLAMVSVSLGVLNLLPLPMLDGGHLLYYLFEGVTGRPVSDLWLAWLQRGGAVLLLLIMSIALSNDVARHLGLQ